MSASAIDEAGPSSIVFGHHQARHEADGIEKCDEKHQIGDKPVKKCGKSEYSISR